MGRLQRTKGKVFERWVAQQFREAYPFLDGVRRSQQGAGAEQSDVTGVPGLWIECQDAARPTPLAKLVQAERDVAEAKLQGILPIAVVHRAGSSRTSTTVTLRAGAFPRLYGKGGCLEKWRTPPVTIGLSDFLNLAQTYVVLCLSRDDDDRSPKSAGAPGATPQGRGARRDRKETNR